MSHCYHESQRGERFLKHSGEWFGSWLVNEYYDYVYLLVNTSNVWCGRMFLLLIGDVMLMMTSILCTEGVGFWTSGSSRTVYLGAMQNPSFSSCLPSPFSQVPMAPAFPHNPPRVWGGISQRWVISSFPQISSYSLHLLLYHLSSFLGPFPNSVMAVGAHYKHPTGRALLSNAFWCNLK